MAKKINQCFECRKPSRYEHEAIKSLSKGDATEHQQQLALKYIIDGICRSDDLLFIPDSMSETGVLNGRAFVGKKLQKLIKLPLSDDKEAET